MNPGDDGVVSHSKQCMIPSSVGFPCVCGGVGHGVWFFVHFFCVVLHDVWLLFGFSSLSIG